MGGRRTFKGRIKKLLGVRNQHPVVYVSFLDKLAIIAIGHQVGLEYAEIGPMLLKLGLAFYRNKGDAELKRLIDLATGDDYLARYRKSGFKGLSESCNGEFDTGS